MAYGVMVNTAPLLRVSATLVTKSQGDKEFVIVDAATRLIRRRSTVEALWQGETFGS